VVGDLLISRLRTNIIREDASDDVLSGKIVVKILVIMLHPIPQVARFEWVRVINVEAFSETGASALVPLAGGPKESRNGRSL
jgi:aspartate-semialdehyde dehydrogenase